MNLLRTAVSGKRNRYRDDGFDLDLTYITPRCVGHGESHAIINATPYKL